MYIDHKGNEFESIIGKRAIVRVENGCFDEGDLVVILEDDTTPYCILEEDFNKEISIEGNLNFSSHDYNEITDLEILEENTCSIEDEITALEKKLEELKNKKKKIEIRELNRRKAETKLEEVETLVEEIAQLGFSVEVKEGEVKLV